MAAAALMLTSCEKPYVGIPASDVRNVELSFVLTDTRSIQPVEYVCSRLNVAIFKDGEKLKSIAQTDASDDFGAVRVALGEGTYDVVAVAHNGQGTATITSEDKVTFANNKVTDTFVYCDQIEVGEDVTGTHCQMHRAVAMVRFEDVAVPDGTAQLKFYYLGGSSTLSPSAGFGVVNSKQTELRDASGKTYEIYTFPHSLNDVLTKITVTALDSEGETLDEVIITDVPVRLNEVTEIHRPLFNGGTVAQNVLDFTCDPEWAGIINYE